MPRASDIPAALVPAHHVQVRAPCNLRCFYCYERPHPRKAPAGILEIIEEDLRRARGAGYRVVVFGAAELLLLPGWEEAIRTARRLGFERVLMLSNLLAITERRLAALVQAGLDGIAGTLFAASDADALAVSGGKRVLSRQIAAARRIGADGRLSFSVHVILTRSLAVDPAASVLRLRDAVVPGARELILSAIEPISEAVPRHPQYTHGLELDWERLLDATDREGLALVVQNVPACLLGRHAHRSLFLRRRVGRILAGWPGDPDAARFVDRRECLGSRIPPTGSCVGCPLLAVCHRYFDYPVKRRVEGGDDRVVVERLLAEQGVAADPGPIVSVLRSIAARQEPGAGARS